MIKCPKCNSGKIEEKLSHGGPAIYKRLVCKSCKYEGGSSRVYRGEKERIEKEITERFLNKDNRPDAVRQTLAAYGL